MSNTPLLMVTGANGFVGYTVLVGALKAGYRVRAVVRRQAAIDTISRGPSVQERLSNGLLTFALVLDNTIPGAYHDAARACSYIIHTASPLGTTPGDLVSQAIGGCKAILEAAEATPSVKRVVFTGSNASIRPWDRLFLEHPANQALMSGRGDEVPALTAETRVPTQPTLSEDALGWHKYVNSKIAAANFLREYTTTDGFQSAHFSIVDIMPAWILGPNELVKSKQTAFNGSNLILSWLFVDLRMAPMMGLPSDKDIPWLPETVHRDDVVECHVKALEIDKVPGRYRNFLLSSDTPTGPVFMDAIDTVRKNFPREVAEGRIPLAGKLDTIPYKFDVTCTENDLLGHPFRPYEQQVIDTVDWYLHLED
ncbi:MAG: hypothetical protein Q9181_001923 [Wetmoreana brouardii]